MQQVIQIDIHKDIFDDENNDPRIYGSSSMGDNNFTTIKKGVYYLSKKRWLLHGQ